MKNIAMLIPNLQSGGSERMASRLSKMLSDKYNVFVILFDKENQNYEFSGKLVDLSLKAASNPVKKVILMLKRIFKIRKIIHLNNIDIVFSFTSSANNALFFSFVKCKKIVSCRGFEFLKKYHRLYNTMVKCGCEILFNAKEMEQFYLEKYPKDESKTHTIYNIFDVDNINLLATNSLEEKEKAFFDTHKIITTVSHFSPTKGQWNLIKVFELVKEKVPNAGLVFVGYRGELESDIKKMANRSKYAKDILFLGFQSNPFKYVAKSYVYALCSISEGFPNALVEAMICGTPVVATNCISGPAEILFNEYKPNYKCNEIIYADYGVITPPFDAEIDMELANKTIKHKIFAKAIENLLLDKELRKKYFEQGSTRGCQFNESQVANQYIALIEQ